MFVGDMETSGKKWIDLMLLFKTLNKHLLPDE